MIIEQRLWLENGSWLPGYLMQTRDSGIKLEGKGMDLAGVYRLEEVKVQKFEFEIKSPRLGRGTVTM
jgi:hypothetical protein